MARQSTVRNDGPMREEIDVSVTVPMSAGALYPLVSAATSTVENLVGLTKFTAETCVHLASEASKSATNEVLDRVVPPLFGAILSRVDLTEIVLNNVDVNAIVAQTQLDPIIDRIPMTEIADYVIEEIDLPTLVRESTGGVADDILGLLRFQALETDNFLSTVVDRVLFRKKTRAQEIDQAMDSKDSKNS
jgi:hypothetical protein